MVDEHGEQMTFGVFDRPGRTGMIVCIGVVNNIEIDMITIDVVELPHLEI